MKFQSFKSFFSEDMPVNNTSQVDGIGTGDKGEPGVTKKQQKKLRRNNKWLFSRQQS